MTLAKLEESRLPILRVEEDPVAVMERATRQANALMDVVEKKKQYIEIEGKKYLYVEAWEIIGAFNGVHAETEWVNPIKEGDAVGDAVIGYTAKVNLIKNGEVVGSGIMPCGFQDFPCRGKEGMAKHKACQSAAQTWAESKAYRMNFSYVAVLGGYQPTPAEEMIGDGLVSKTTTAGNKYLCPIHNVEWFKSPKMKAYAHPIKGTEGKGSRGGSEWCRMEDVAKAATATLIRTREALDKELADAQEGPPDDLEAPSEAAAVPHQGDTPQKAVFDNLGAVFSAAGPGWQASGLSQILTRDQVATAAGWKDGNALTKAIGDGSETLEQVWGQVMTLYGRK